MRSETVYTVIPWAPTPEQWVDVIQTPESCRKSLSGDKVVLKWVEEARPPHGVDKPAYMHTGHPDSLEGCPRYTHAEILSVMQSEEWTSPPEN